MIAALMLLFAPLAQVQAQARLYGSRSKVQEFDNEDGFYLGGSWGQMNLKLDGIGKLGHGFSEVLKSENNIWKATAGYRFNPYAALEASYVNFGSNPDNGPDAGKSSSGYIPALVITIPDGSWELFGKLGYYTYSSQFDFMYGIGFGYTFSGRFNLSFDYQVIDVPGPNTDALWLNGAIRF